MFHCSYLYLRFVYYGIAATTLRLLLVSTQAQTQQNPTRPSPGPFSSYANYSPSLATVFIVLISLFCIVGFLSIYLRHFSHFFGIPSPATTRLEAARGIHPSVLESFPTFLYSDVKSHRLGTPHALECAVCLSEFEDNEILQMLPGCCHVFHPTCIQPWLFSHVTCPVCRADLRYDSYQLKPPPPPAPPPYDWITRQQSETDQSEPSNNHHHDNNITLYMGTQSPEITRKNQDRTRGKLPRSHSTGHSLAEDCDRFTLRLPIDIRNKLVNSTVVLPIAGSPRIGYREMARSVGCTGGKQFEPDRPWRFSVSPPFICRTGLGMSPAKSDGGTEYPGEGSSRRRLIEIDGVTQSSLVLKR